MTLAGPPGRPNILADRYNLPRHSRLVGRGGYAERRAVGGSARSGRRDHPPKIAPVATLSASGPRPGVRAWRAPALCLRGQPVPALFDTSAREEAQRAIPFDQMNEPARAKVWEVVSRPSVFRRFPPQVIDSDPEFYVFLVRYPEVIVNMWQLMGVTKVQVKRKGAYAFDATDGAGTTSAVELVYGRPDLHVFYADGLYEGPLLHRRVDGDCVLLLRSTYAKRNDRTVVTSHLDAFVRLNDVGTEIVAKTLQPVVGKAVDNNFLESIGSWAKCRRPRNSTDRACNCWPAG